VVSALLTFPLKISGAGFPQLLSGEAERKLLRGGPFAVLRDPTLRHERLSATLGDAVLCATLKVHLEEVALRVDEGSALLQSGQDVAQPSSRPFCWPSSP
jgi:hypothetical protein